MKFEKQIKLIVMYRYRQEQNNDVIIVVTGDRGDGKSNFALTNAKLYVLTFGLVCKSCGHDWITTKKLTRKEQNNYLCSSDIYQPCPKCKSADVKKQTSFNFKKYLAYDHAQIVDRINNLDMYSPLIGDEAMRWASRENWQLRENKYIKELISQDRTRRLIKYIVIQRFQKLDRLLQSYCDYWLKVLQREGNQVFAHILRKSKGEVPEEWNIKQYQELFGDYNNETSIDDLEKRTFKLSKHPNFYEFMNIPKFPDDEYEKYQEYRDSNVYNQKTNTAVDEKLYGKIVAYNAKNNLEMTVRDIEAKLFTNPKTLKPVVSFQTISKWENEIKNLVESKE